MPVSHMLRTPRWAQRGLSLVEMMVGVAVGLIVVAGASLLVSTQLGENRRLLIETQLQQDLRASADIIARELRRAGTRTESLALKGLWYPGHPAEDNELAAALVTGARIVEFKYQPTSGPAGPFGFKLQSGVIKTNLGSADGSSNWQDLTDSNVMLVTEFAITPAHSNEIRLPCPRLCADNTSDCWPRVQVRELKVVITAKARNFPEIERTIDSLVRLRNDYVSYFEPAVNQICPL